VSKVPLYHNIWRENETFINTKSAAKQEAPLPETWQRAGISYRLLVTNLLKRFGRYCLTHAISGTMISPCPIEGRTPSMKAEGNTVLIQHAALPPQAEAPYRGTSPIRKRPPP